MSSARPSRRSRPSIVLVQALLLASSFAGCRGEPEAGDPDLRLDVAVSPTPPAVGPARLLVTLRDSSGAPVEGARITVEGNMSHAGMMPVLDTAEARGSGSYVVPEFDFTMAGDWVLTLEAVLPDGRGARTSKPLNVVGGMGGGI